MSKIIDSFLKYVPSESWIKQSSKLPWLKLNIDVPAQQILLEANDLYHRAVLHRSSDAFGQYSHQGWKSLTIYGESSTVTGHSDAIKSWTDVADLCPVTVDFIKRYWNINDTTGRIRFMWLEPGGYILPHSDRNHAGFYETNIAIHNPVGCNFRFLDYGTVPFVNGSAYLVDISNKHLVYNNSNELRTHIIVHAQHLDGVIRSSYEQNFYS